MEPHLKFLIVMAFSILLLTCLIQSNTIRVQELEIQNTTAFAARCMVGGRVEINGRPYFCEIQSLGVF